MTVFRLQDLLKQDERAIAQGAAPRAIAATSTLMGMSVAQLDCQGVEFLSNEQLEALFSAIPQDWNFDKVGEIIDPDTLSESLAQQLVDWIDRRLGRENTQQPTSTPPQENKAEPKSDTLDIFNLRDSAIADYRRYIESFLKIRDPKVKEFVATELDKGQLWKDPLIQLNPAYKRSAEIDSLICEGILHSDCRSYFPGFNFYHHQERAFRCARQNRPLVLTTGTGSGKSLSYVVPIIDDLLRNPDQKGVRAILVYPMNALINSQEEEFKKFLSLVPNSHIRVEKYTGQESLQRKTEIQNNAPPILLTNYVMLELMLTRVHEDKLIETCVDTLKQMFLWSSKIKGLPFRLHQFISQGGSVYATLEGKDKRFLTLEGQYKTTGDRLLYPLAFCRECGQDYYVVRYDSQNNRVTPLLPTALDSDLDEEDIQEGYLTLDEPDLWNERDTDRLPDNWFKETKRSGRVAKKEYASFIPRKLYIYPNGTISTSLIDNGSTPCWFIPKPFLTCLNFRAFN